MWSEEDRKFMKIALGLAEKGLGRTNPNPMVGAVIVRNGRVIAEGWHRKYGRGKACGDGSHCLMRGRYGRSHHVRDSGTMLPFRETTPLYNGHNRCRHIQGRHCHD